MFLLTILSCAPAKVDFVVSDLRCEYLPEPIGIEARSPRLSWKMGTETQGAFQSDYQIQVATSNSLLEKNLPDLWDSGIVKSECSSQVDYKGKELNPGMKVFWRVRIRNQQHNTSDWSKTANWEMGLLSEVLWQAKWIGAPESVNTGNWKLPGT